MEKKDYLKELSAPFEVQGADGNIYPAHKWKVAMTKGKYAQCVPYIDARQVAARLNQVLGVDGWTDTLIETAGDGVICELTCIIAGTKVTRSNVGVPSEYAKTKGMASDALKRAASKFGVGAYLYEFEPVNLAKVSKAGKIYAATEDGKALVTGDELTSYINMKHPLRAKLTEIYNALNSENKKELSKTFETIWKKITE